MLGELLAEATPCSRDLSSAYYFTRFLSNAFLLVCPTVEVEEEQGGVTSFCLVQRRFDGSAQGNFVVCAEDRWRGKRQWEREKIDKDE